MGLISTRQYDRAMSFLSDLARNIRTSPPMQAVRKLHSQSFQEVQQVQSEIERFYQIQYRPAQSASQPSRNARHALPSGRPNALPPANRPSLGQLPPPRPDRLHPGQPPAHRSPQPPRYPQRPEWQQRRSEQ
ncbi:MAG: hypothetical protein AAGA40_14475 [Cyanobacteria bacterium P01_E01_bin.45]